MDNLCGNPLPDRQIEGPKIEVEDLSSPKKVADADKNYSNQQTSTCQSEDKPKESTKEEPKVPEIKKLPIAPVEDKPTPNSARVTPTPSPL